MADNPWLTIPLEDYESHMALPEIGQAQMLAEELTRAACQMSAASVAVVGCTGGNGLAALPACVRRIVGIDINQAYVEALRGRLSGHGARLELFVADIQEGAPPCAPVDLVYAALIFEYVDLARTMAALRGLCASDGTMVAVIQLPSESARFVSPSPFASLKSLQVLARTRSRQELQQHAHRAGFHPTEAQTIMSAGGKSFDVLRFRG